MLSVFTKRYGKISCGTSITEGGRNKTSLAIRPFALSRFDLTKTRDNYNLNGAEVIQSYFSIGEDIEKFTAASYVLELTDRMLPEEVPSPTFFSLLTEFMNCIDKRKSSFNTLVIAFQLKALALSGNKPRFDACTRCGSAEALTRFSVADGGLICENCARASDPYDPLIFDIKNDTITAIGYMDSHNLQSLGGLALKPEVEKNLRNILKAYISYHLGIEDLKSESLKI